MKFQVELVLPDRQFRGQGLQRRQIGAHRPGFPWKSLGVPIPAAHLLQHFLGRATAVVSDSWNPQRSLHTRGPRPGPLLLKHVQGISATADRSQHQGQQLTTTAASPTEQSMGEGRCGIPGQLVGAEPTNPGLLRHRRHPRGKTKAVRQPAELMGPLRKQGMADVLANRELLPERRGADQNAIGFHPGPVDGFPSAGFAGRLNLGEKTGAMPLNPGVERRR